MPLGFQIRVTFRQLTNFDYIFSTFKLKACRLFVEMLLRMGEQAAGQGNGIVGLLLPVIFRNKFKQRVAEPGEFSFYRRCHDDMGR